MIWQRPAAAKKIPNATVPQPKFVNLKLLNCYNNAAIKNHLPLIYIYMTYYYYYDINTSWTHPQQLPTPNKYLCGHEILESSMIQVTQGKFAAGPLSIRKVGSINACWVFDRGWIHPANLVMTNPFFWRNCCHFLQRWSKYMYQKPPGQQHQFLAVFHPFWLATGLIFWCSWMFLMVFFINLSQGLVYPLPWKM